MAAYQLFVGAERVDLEEIYFRTCLRYKTISKSHKVHSSHNKQRNYEFQNEWQNSWEKKLPSWIFYWPIGTRSSSTCSSPKQKWPSVKSDGMSSFDFTLDLKKLISQTSNTNRTDHTILTQHLSEEFASYIRPRSKPAKSRSYEQDASFIRWNNQGSLSAPRPRSMLGVCVEAGDLMRWQIPRQSDS